MSLENLDQKLQAEQPKLSTAEQAELWQRIALEVGEPKAVISPYTFYLTFINTRTMTSFIIALVILLGAGGTVAASEAAKPGDLLFPIERAAEKTRLAFAGEERATELKAAFANERLEELLEIIKEEGTVTAYDDSASTSASSTGAIVTFSAEADVFTDITVVKVEANDQKRIFTTATTTKAGVIAEIARRYDLASSTIEAALSFEIEDRASRPSERGVVVVDNAGEERISKAVNVLLDLLEDVDNEDARNGLLIALLTQIDNVSVKGRDDSKGGDDSRIDVRTDDSRVKIDDDRVEIRDGGYRIRIDKDGEVRVKQDDDSRDDDSDDDSDNDRRSNSSNSSSTSNSSTNFEAEADVFSDVTIVEVEINDRKTTFTTTATTKAGVVDEIVRRYGVAKATVEATLDFEVEDRASRADDGDEAESDDRDDDHSSNSSSTSSSGTSFEDDDRDDDKEEDKNNEDDSKDEDSDEDEDDDRSGRDDDRDDDKEEDVDDDRNN